jgi:hypothetical protein
MPDLIPHPPEFWQDFFGNSGQAGRVDKTDMDPLHNSEKERALFVGRTTEGNDVVKPLSGELVQNLGAMSGDVDPNLRQNLTGQRIDPRGLGAGGKRLEAVAQVVINEPFGHPGAAEIVSAEEQDALLWISLDIKEAMR